MASTSAPAEHTADALDLLLDCVLAARLQGASVLATVAARGHEGLLRALIKKYEIAHRSSSTAAEAAAATAGAGPLGGPAPAGTAPAAGAEAAPATQAAPADGGAVGGEQEPGAAASAQSSATVASSGPCSPLPVDLAADLAAAVLAAAEHGHASCLRALLDAAAATGPAAVGQLVAARSPDRQLTPLMLAALGRHADCVDALLRHSPVVQVVAASTVPVLLQYSEPLPAGCTALMFAGAVADRDCVECLLAHARAAQVAAVDADGSNALTWAASGTEDCRADLLRLLLVDDPDIQVAVAATSGPFKGSTALICATSYGNAACVEALLEHSPAAQVAAHSSDGWTALMHTMRWPMSAGHMRCVELLLRHSPETQVAARDAGQNTALMRAVDARAAPATIELLLRHSPEQQVMAVDDRGSSPLMAAALILDCTTIMRTLLQHCPEAQLAIVNPSMGSALTWCAAAGNAAGLELLLPLRPSADSLHTALLRAANALHKLPDDAAWSKVRTRPSVESLHTVVELLLSAGAMLAPDDDPSVFAAVQPVIQDVARRARVPDRVNEAVVGLALAGSSSRKRLRDEGPGAA